MNILIESTFAMFNRRLHVPKYTVLNIMSKRAILKKCVVLTGGLEVSFSICIYSKLTETLNIK